MKPVLLQQKEANQPAKPKNKPMDFVLALDRGVREMLKAAVGKIPSGISSKRCAAPIEPISFERSP